MRVLVVYESVMGNTREIAEAVATGVRSEAPRAVVRCLPAGRVLAEPLDADLLVVGAPTHHFGLPAERTRRMWVRDALRRGRAGGGAARLEPGATGPGLREWFDGLPAMDAAVHPLRAAHPDVRVGRADAPRARAAAFDTRLDRPMAGSAARRIARLLRRHGYPLVARPEGFVVEHTEGPLRLGERERAQAWGGRLAHAAGLVEPAAGREV